MFCTLLKKALNINLGIYLLIPLILLMLLVKIDLSAQSNNLPVISSSENMEYPKNEDLPKSMSDSVDYQAQKILNDSVSSKSFNLAFSNAGIDSLKMGEPNDSSISTQVIMDQKVDSGLLDENEFNVSKKNPTERIRGSRKKLGIYMTVAGISLIIAALIINNK